MKIYFYLDDHIMSQTINATFATENRIFSDLGPVRISGL